jgi:hypothetical protein
MEIPMKHFLVLGLALFSLNAHSEKLEVDLQGFNFTYAEPHGSGSATHFYRNFDKSAGGVEIEVAKELTNLNVKVRGSEEHDFVIRNAPSIIQDAKSMTIDEMNLKLTDHFSLNLYSGEFVSEKDAVTLEGLDWFCKRGVSKDVMDEILLGCVQDMTVRADKFLSEKTSRFLAATLLKTQMGSNLKITQLKLKSRGGSYDLSADVKAQLSGSAKSKGNLSYDPGTGILTIKINEVKFGILSVKGMVFDELKKNESESMRVKEPYVYLKLKK